jgi:hypothetical protein
VHGGDDRSVAGRVTSTSRYERCHSSYPLKFNRLRVPEGVGREGHGTGRSVEIAALKKYLFSFFQIALGSEAQDKEGSLCLLN